MQVLITSGAMARTRALHFSRLQLLLALALLILVLMSLSGAIYHFVFLKAARDGWPVVSQLVKLVVKDEIAQRDRFMRENLDAMAQKVGEMQAKLVKLEALSDRVAAPAGLKPEELKPLQRGVKAASGGQGGPFVPLDHPSLDAVNGALAQLDQMMDEHTDVFTLIESRQLESRLVKLLLPSTAPVMGPVGSGFGFRSDPFTGRAALHTGLDYPAEVGTPVAAAAGGMVRSVEAHPAYGQLLEIDHNNGLVTRYAHNSRILVRQGEVIKRGQKVAEIGNTGRSTGAHLHFEVLLDGVPQNPARFLAGASTETARQVAKAPAQAASARTRRVRAAAAEQASEPTGEP